MINMVVIDGSRTTFSFTGDHGKFNFTGSCVLEEDNFTEIMGEAVIKQEEIDFDDIIKNSTFRCVLTSYEDTGKYDISLFAEPKHMLVVLEAVLGIIEDLKAEYAKRK